MLNLSSNGTSSFPEFGVLQFKIRICQLKLRNNFLTKYNYLIVFLITKHFYKFFIIIFYREGFERGKLARDDSLILSYYKTEDSNFRQNPFRFQIAIIEPIDYSNATVRQVSFLKAKPTYSNLFIIFKYLCKNCFYIFAAINLNALMGFLVFDY